jgi:type IV pilus assembly protein PilW
MSGVLISPQLLGITMSFASKACSVRFARGHRYGQRGLSLLELMIALVLGSLLVAGAAKILVSNSQSFKLQENISSTQEAGRLALESILADLRRAGLGVPAGTAAVVGTNSSTAVAAALPGLLAASDSVSISYVAVDPSVTPADCSGDAAVLGDTITNTYQVAADTNPTIAALSCTGRVVSGVTGLQTSPVTPVRVVLLRGVESFQVLYGKGSTVVGGLPGTATSAQAAGNGYQQAVQYVTAGGATPNTPIASIRVAFLVRSEAGIQGLSSPQQGISVLDSTVSPTTLAAAIGNNKMTPVHRFFEGTAALRNTATGTF